VSVVTRNASESNIAGVPSGTDEIDDIVQVDASAREERDTPRYKFSARTREWRMPRAKPSQQRDAAYRLKKSLWQE